MSKVVKNLVYLACIDNPVTNKVGRPSLNSSLVKKVNQFYEQDDNSRMSS